MTLASKSPPSVVGQGPRAQLDFPVVRLGGPPVKNRVADLTAPKLNPGQFSEAFQRTSERPVRLILPATYHQFADTHVHIPNDLREALWQPAFFVTAHEIKLSGDWGDQLVSVAPLFLLSIVDAGDPRLPGFLAMLFNQQPGYTKVSMRELFYAWDRQGDLP